MKPITENIIEQSAIEILQSQGWEYANGKEMSIKDNIKDNLSLIGGFMKENTHQRQNRVQFVLNKPLFDLKNASSHKSLIYIIFLIALESFEGLASWQLFPFWKQLEQLGSFIQIENC